MSRIQEAFQGKKAFIPFITCGDPDLETTEQLVYAMEKEGAAVIELGIPFSDPTAEGPVIQAANLRGLGGGVTTDKVFETVEKIRKNSRIPLVFMTYANVVFSYGIGRFVKRMKETGMDGLILPDVPFEEKEEFDSVCREYGIELISLIAPTSHERIRMIAEKASGFVYCVSSLGVTGTRSEITTDIGEMVRLVKEAKDIPCAVGFGISTPEQAAEMCRQADGVIVGSAIVKLCGAHGRDCVALLQPLCESFFPQPVDEKRLAVPAPPRHAVELQDRKPGKYNGEQDEQDHGIADAPAAADRAAECVHSISKRQISMDICDKRRRDLNRISAGGAGELHDHKDQHEKTSHFSERKIEKVHNRGKCRCGKAGKQYGLSHFRRGEPVDHMKQPDQHKPLQDCHRIEDGRFGRPPCKPGSEFPVIFCQRVHKAEGKASHPQSYRHHVRRHGMSVIFYCGDLCLVCIHRGSEHMDRFFACGHAGGFVRSFGQAVCKDMSAVLKLRHPFI